jgi:hypothetical protein
MPRLWTRQVSRLYRPSRASQQLGRFDYDIASAYEAVALLLDLCLVVGINWPYDTAFDWAPGARGPEGNFVLDVPLNLSLLVKCEDIATLWHLLDNILWDASVLLILLCWLFRSPSLI